VGRSISLILSFRGYFYLLLVVVLLLRFLLSCLKFVLTSFGNSSEIPSPSDSSNPLKNFFSLPKVTFPIICVSVGVEALLSNFFEESSNENSSCGSKFDEAVMQFFLSIEFSLIVFSKDFLNYSRKNRAGFLLLFCALLLLLCCFVAVGGGVCIICFSPLLMTSEESM
jgi:hypothetical protein